VNELLRPHALFIPRRRVEKNERNKPADEKKRPCAKDTKRTALKCGTPVFIDL
jgi:hypothetical protein